MGVSESASTRRRASDNDTLCLICLKKVAQFVRGVANLAADRCERSNRERTGAMHRDANMSPVCMTHHVVAAGDPFQFPVGLTQCLDDVFPESRTGIRPYRRR